MKKKVKMYDPPQGWRYGFPKPLPEHVITGDELKEWLIANGYPESDVHLALKFGRWWDQEVDCE